METFQVTEKDVSICTSWIDQTASVGSTLATTCYHYLNSFQMYIMSSF